MDVGVRTKYLFRNLSIRLVCEAWIDRLLARMLLEA